MQCKITDNTYRYPPRLPRSTAGRKQHDILCPSITPGYYQHIGKAANTNHEVQLYEWRLKKEDYLKQREQEGKKENEKDYTYLKYEEHARKRQFQRLVRDKVAEKLKAYESTIEERRERLKNLFYKEEREYFYETVDLAQKCKEKDFQQIKIKAEMLRKKREEERLKVVHQKRIEQYSNRCQELRPILFKKNLIETKHAQLQQMKENEARREAERELDKLWHALIMKEAKARMERDEQEAIERDQIKRGIKEVWDRQVKGKELLKEEEQKIAQEDRIEMMKLSEELRKEEIGALDEKRKKRDELAKELLNQVIQQEALLKKRQEEEKAIDDAYCMLSQLEMQREKEKLASFTEQYKKESEMYRKNLKELEEERKKEEKQLEELLAIHQKEIQKKQDDAKCKLWEAKQKLQQSVLKTRDEQVAYKRQEAEEQLKLKQAENELLRMRYDQNERLQAESDRLEAEAVRQYREDLKKQIEYNNIQREKERQELERQLEEGRKEEEKYQKIIEDMVKFNTETGGFNKHPFRRVLERYECHCPSNVF